MSKTKLEQSSEAHGIGANACASLPGMTEPIHSPPPGQFSTRRLERFADLIFAFALLVMIGDIVLLVEDYVNHEGGWSYIRADIDAASAFLLNAAIIGYYWVMHQKYFSYYRRTNGAHIAFEILFLVVIVTMPFSNYVMRLDEDGLTPIFLVSAEIFLASVFLALSWSYATKDNRLTASGEPDEETRRTYLREALMVPVVTVIAVLLALVDTRLWLPAFIVVPAILRALKLV